MSAPRVLVVQHEAECPPAWIGDWLTESGCALDVRRPYAGEDLPDHLGEHDGLVVLGGAMGATDDQFPWIPRTRALIREAAERERPTLGICLGHQLAAVALDGHVARNRRGQQLGLIETGWLPAAADDPLFHGLTSTRRGIQFNDDIVDRLPQGAVLLAETPAGEPQAVRFAPTVWGVQLHPEADHRVIGPWAESDQGRYDDGRVMAALAEVTAAADELERGWRPLGSGFAALLTSRVH